MKTIIIFISILLLTLIACSNNEDKPVLSYSESVSGSVFVCTGPSSKAYHKTKNCKGLRNCSKDIISVTLDEAKNMNRKPCGYCYK